MRAALRFLLIASCLVLAVLGKRHPRSAHPRCQQIQHQDSLLFPYLCMSDEEYAELGNRGRQFKATANPSTLNPVLLVPGLGGSGLEAKLQNAKEPHWYCYSNLDWFRTWLALGSMVGGYVDCWYNNMAIYFNPSTNTYNFGAGVSSRVIDWGGLRGIDYLDTDFSGNGLSFTSYFGPLIKELQGVGYVAGKNLRGAPFDWRKAVDPDGMYLKMKTLIETMYTENGNLPVHILAHSMGNIHTGLMLTNVVDQAWKDKYIASFISVAAPWSGSPKALRALISGDNFGLGAGDWFSLVDPLQIAKITRQSGGVVLLTPEADYWNNTVLVKTPTRTYNADELTQLFVDMGSPITAQLKKSLDGVLMNSIKAPGVPMHCLYGVDYPTEMSFTYKEGFGKKPEIAYSEEGDGTVPDVSLRQCKKFALQQEQPVHVFEFDLADHLSVLNDDDLVKYVLDLLTE